ncbi:MAG: hypothetical protein J7M38_05765, partial [Armatimonadetes bacterium]|nr:hypothetical protein [Armatimonadota bacterium]
MTSDYTPPAPSSPATRPAGVFGIAPRAIFIGIALTVGAAVWVAQVEMVLHTAEISESVPLIASLAGLIALVVYNRTIRALAGVARENRFVAAAALLGASALSWLLHLGAGGGLRTFLALAAITMFAAAVLIARSRRAALRLHAWELSRREMIVIYCFLTLSALMMSAKVSGYIIPEMTVYTYFGFGNPTFEEALPNVPSWLVIKDAEAVRALYEGSDLNIPALPAGPAGEAARAFEGLWWPLMQVPWRSWLGPLLVWVGLMTLVFTAGLCLMALVKPYWVEKERLSFPLVMIPLEMSSAGMAESAGTMLHTWAFRAGFLLSGLFTFYVVMHAVNPGLPAFRPYYSLAPLFREHPWNAVRHTAIHIRPEMMGMSYFMNSDVTFTIWISTIATDLLAVLTRAMGYETRHFPRPFDQGVGSYVMVALVLLWSVRGWLSRGLRAAFSGADTPQARRQTALWLGLLSSLGGLVALMIIAGMKPWVAVYLFGIILAFFLVYGRARAETGVPHPSAYPMGGHMHVLNYLGGPVSWAGGATPALLGNMFLLGRGYTVTGAGAQIENLKLADEQRIRQDSMTWLSLAAPAVGLVIALVMRLGVSYHYGLNFLEGGVVQGGYA